MNNNVIKTFGLIAGVSTTTAAIVYTFANRIQNEVNAESSVPEILHTSSHQTEHDIRATLKSHGLGQHHSDVQSHQLTFNKKFKKIVPKLFKILQQTKEECGSPGLSFAISHDGELVAKGGIGLADVENDVICTDETSMRIASISKSLTSIAVGKLLEQHLLDLDVPIETYLKDFQPIKFEGKPVTITTRQLLSHTSGIRGYFDDPKKFDEKSTDNKKRRKHSILIQKHGAECGIQIWDENFSMKHFKTVKDGLELFQNDPLIYQPGSDFEYSSLAYSLISRIIEETSGKDYVTFMKDVCRDLGMSSTRVDLNDPIVPNRARNYCRSKSHKLLNSPYVDNSYKWSGGGFLSNVNDLTCLGNSMLKSYSTNIGYLHPSTVRTLWQPVEASFEKYRNYQYALGWSVQTPSDVKPYLIHHTGGAIGCSSVLMIIPGNHKFSKAKETSVKLTDKLNQTSSEANIVTLPHDKSNTMVKGTVITIIVNMQGVGLVETADRLNDVFQHGSVSTI